MKPVYKRTIVSLALATMFIAPAPVLAGPLARAEVKADVKAEVRERREDRKDLFSQFKDAISSKTGAFKGFLGFGRAAIGSGEITAKTDTTLTVKKDDKTYTVTLGDKTKFRRRFWGKSDLAEFSVGDTINVIGMWTDDSHTSITAVLLRDVSIQKRFGVFFGQVKSILSNGWIMSTVSAKRPDQTVTVSSSTKFVNRKGETITQADVKVGARVRVRGLWDNKSNTVTEVNEVKDFSLPPFPSVTAAVSPTSSPTPTATPTP